MSFLELGRGQPRSAPTCGDFELRGCVRKGRRGLQATWKRCRSLELTPRPGCIYSIPLTEERLRSNAGRFNGSATASYSQEARRLSLGNYTD